jgi:hypothetical protein
MGLLIINYSPKFDTLRDRSFIIFIILSIGHTGLEDDECDLESWVEFASDL